MKTKTLLLTIAAAVILTSCTTNPSNGTQLNLPDDHEIVNTQTKDIFPSEQTMNFPGRFQTVNDILWMTQSSTGAEFYINAKRLDITIKGDSYAENATDEDAARIAVFLNGQRIHDRLITDSERSYIVFDGTETVSGLIQILKISEAPKSTAGLKKITIDTDGTISKPDNRKLKIEFIGDSITCGYGVDAPNQSHHFKTATEDNTKTYAYLTAQNLSADYSMVCISGSGIVSSYPDGNKKNTAGLAPDYYEKLALSWGNTFEGQLPQDINWDFSKFQPDIIVINLGTNDTNYVTNDSRRKEFSEGYANFLKLIRKNNPNAHIICSLGTLGQDLCQTIEKAAGNYKNETGDTKVYYFKFDVQNSSDGVGADWHPNKLTHKKAAEKLTKFIQNNIPLN